MSADSAATPAAPDSSERLPLAARAYVGAVVAGSAAAIVAIAVTRGVTFHGAAPLLVLLPALFAADRVTIRSKDATLRPTDAFMLTAALLVPVTALWVMGLSSMLATYVQPPHQWAKRAFNGGMAVFEALGAALVARALLDPGSAGPAGLRIALAGAAATLAYFLINSLFLGVILRLTGVDDPWKATLAPRLLLTTLGFGAMATTAYALYHAHLTVVAALVFAPLLFVWDSARVPYLEREARIDSKTGLLTARTLQEKLDEELDPSGGREGVLLLADLDLLRDVNNTYGHLAGDAVLEAVGGAIRATVRAQDVAGRFGGEEFCILLPGVDREGGRAIAERLREAVAALRVPLADGRTIGITISIGLVAYPRPGYDATTLMHEADTALYSAKRTGRNRTCLAF
jgi:diguanylate cyclase (GGDEF)-like protein